MTAAPERMCAACHTRRKKQELLRFVRAADGAIVPDVGGKRQGRGAYLCRSAVCIKKARKSRSLERALKGTLAAGVLEEIERITEVSDG